MSSGHELICQAEKKKRVLQLLIHWLIIALSIFFILSEQTNMMKESKMTAKNSSERM